MNIFVFLKVENKVKYLAPANKANTHIILRVFIFLIVWKWKKVTVLDMISEKKSSSYSVSPLFSTQGSVKRIFLKNFILTCWLHSARSLHITSVHVFLVRPLAKLLPISKFWYLLGQKLSTIFSRWLNHTKLQLCKHWSMVYNSVEMFSSAVTFHIHQSFLHHFSLLRSQLAKSHSHVAQHYAHWRNVIYLTWFFQHYDK